MTKLFVYGIFLDETVRRNAFGTDVPHERATLNGYSISEDLVLGRYKTIKEDPTNFTEGLLLDIPEEYLSVTDMIEGVSSGLYKRIQVGSWWVYIH